MNIKALPGITIAYMESRRNYKNELRPVLPGTQPTQWIGRYPKLELKYFNQVAPPHVTLDRRRHLLRHCRKHTAHLIIGFSEGYQVVKPFLPLAIRTTECLVGAGLPLENLDFFWAEHPLLENSHLHGGLLRTLLPDRGWYDPALSWSLAMDCSWLFSRRLNLSDPMDKLKSRLLHGCEFSYQGPNRQTIDAFCRTAHDRFIAGQLPDHKAFLKLIREQLGEVVVSPLPDGKPGRLSDGPIGRLYNHAVAVRDDAWVILWFAGLVCRHNFNADLARQDLDRRLQEFENPHVVYARFRRQLLQRIAAQLRKYGCRPGQFMVTLDRFDWFNPANDGDRYLCLDTMKSGKNWMENCIELPEVAPRNVPGSDQA